MITLLYDFYFLFFPLLWNSLLHLSGDREMLWGWEICIFVSFIIIDIVIILIILFSPSSSSSLLLQYVCMYIIPPRVKAEKLRFRLVPDPKQGWEHTTKKWEKSKGVNLHHFIPINSYRCVKKYAVYHATVMVWIDR